MTYGENAGVIRDELAALLRHHRIQQRLGGPGIHSLPESTTLDERAEMGRTIQRYRYLALSWSRQAIESVSPKTDAHQRTSTPRTAVEELRYRVDRSLCGKVHGGGPPLLDLLATAHEFELLIRWQRIARAAALGEHDFAANVNLGFLTTGEGRTVIKDAADVVRGLVVLDRRYELIPGWSRLRGAAALNWCAETVAHQCTEEAGDLGVDARGWRPQPAALTGPAPPGVAGAIQAQHNMLVDLARIPNALNLRRLLHAQAKISHEAARCAASAAPELVERFHEREWIYRRLVSQTRDVGGLVGAGGLAVAESHNALMRLEKTASSALYQGESLHELRRLFNRTDARLVTTIEQGFHEKLYVVAMKVPRITDYQVNGIYQPGARWAPATSTAQERLLPFVRERLRPPRPPSKEPDGAQASRKGYEAALAHRPERRGRPR